MSVDFVLTGMSMISELLWNFAVYWGFSCGQMSFLIAHLFT